MWTAPASRVTVRLKTSLEDQLAVLVSGDLALFTLLGLLGMGVRHLSSRELGVSSAVGQRRFARREQRLSSADAVSAVCAESVL